MAAAPWATGPEWKGWGGNGTNRVTRKTRGTEEVPPERLTIWSDGSGKAGLIVEDSDGESAMIAFRSLPDALDIANSIASKLGGWANQGEAN